MSLCYYEGADCCCLAERFGFLCRKLTPSLDRKVHPRKVTSELGAFSVVPYRARACDFAISTTELNRLLFFIEGKINLYEKPQPATKRDYNTFVNI